MPIDVARAKSLFLSASDLANPDERADYLNRECGGDLELLDRVEKLLRVNDASPFPEPEIKNATQEFIDSSVAVNVVIAGKYKLVEEIGEGGMGHVYMAQQIEPIRRAVAVKVIKAGMDSKGVLARFEAERQALAVMDHPNIARVLDAGVTDSGRPFFVMELIKGVPITEFCDARKMPLRERLQLFVPVCQAIQHAHQKGIIHRDIKPSNVLVALHDDRPVSKVIDFGVAKAVGAPLTDRTLMTGFGAVVGTPEYMSPEQAGFNQVDVDTRSDVYALGVLLYELFTGGTPFSRKELEKAGMLEMLRVIREKEPSKPSTKLSTADGLPTLAANRGTAPAQLTKLVRGDLDWIVMKALEKDRNRRYDSANGFALDLQRYLADEPVLACPPTVVYRLRKFVHRRRAALSVVAFLAAATVFIAVGGWFYRAAVLDANQLRRDSDHAQKVNAAHEQFPVVQAAIRRGEYERAFDILNEIEPYIPDHPDLAVLLDQCSEVCTPTTVPLGVDLSIRRYEQDDAPWRKLTQTGSGPRVVRVPRGEHLWRASKPGYREVIGLRPAQSASFVLDPENSIPPEMIRIPSGSPSQPSLGFSTEFRSVELPTFLIDRYEVTNAEYAKFVNEGGYDNAAYWRDLPWLDTEGKSTTWEKAKAKFLDQTGRPGPATWRDGACLAGESGYPVRGVSWYEAMAYARCAGKSLPTIYHWTLASQVESSVALAGNEFIARSNFGTQVQTVRSLRDVGFHGATGMAGNVKEWCFSESGDGHRFILGGACGEPFYTQVTLDNSRPLRRDEFFGFRCVKFLDDQRGPSPAWEKANSIPWPAPTKREELFDAKTFHIVIQDRFVYDRSAPLEATAEQMDEGDWIHVVAQVNAAYRSPKGNWQRLTLHLYLPKGVDPRGGYQAVVYCPCMDGLILPHMRPLTEEYGLDALVRSGRAVLRPVYHGMYERRTASGADDDRATEDQRISFGQDLMRAIDYLHERGDIDMSRLGYYGFSLGAELGGSFLALEPRIRAAVLEAGGLPNEPLRKDRFVLEWRHYLPEIRIPVLMLNGQVDPIYPVNESQVAMFQLLGSSIKEQYIHPTGHHMLAPDIKFTKMQAWFDRHFGQPKKIEHK
ncbi:MAG: protein kinase domain-containing protein [Gemmataceae bacterium]